MQDIRDHILATPRDIEDLAQLGRELKTCPYYGSRRAIKQAEVRCTSTVTPLRTEAFQVGGSAL